MAATESWSRRLSRRSAAPTAVRGRRSRVERLENRLLLSISGEEQLFVYMLNRARHDPVEYQTEQSLPVDLAYVTPRGPLAVNDSLSDSAEFHAVEMATYNYFGHQSSVTGDWPNKMARDFGYTLPASWSSGANYIESLAAGSYGSYAQPTAPLNALIVDSGVNPPGHRNHLFGIGSFNAANREIGVGYGYNAAATYRNYWAIHATRSDPAGEFLTGVAFNDLNGNGRYDLGEGLAGVTVTANALTTTTNSQGGWAIQATAGVYNVTASGGGLGTTATASVTLGADNVEVDFVAGQSWAVVDFDQTPPTAPIATPGLYDSATAGFHLKNSNVSGGGADIVFPYGPGYNAGWTALVGDFDGNGTVTMGLYDPATAGFHLKNANVAGGGADLAFCYGPGGNRGWIPLVGDWDGNGTDTVGLYDPSSAGFHLKNTNATGGGADLVFCYGPGGNRGWTPLVGDWDGDGDDSPGLYDPSVGGFHLKNTNAGGGPDVTPFVYGPGGAGWRPLTGDWDGDGDDSIGLYDPNAGGFHLKNASVSGGGADVVFSYGPGNPAWVPLTGDWDGLAPAVAAAELSGDGVGLLAPTTPRRTVAAVFSQWEATSPRNDTASPMKPRREPGQAEIEAFFARQ